MKFCSYRYWLNEKFTQDSDPVHDMGIGIDVPRNFKNQNELNKWIYKHLAHILGTITIPNDIINDSQYFIKDKYMEKIEKYVNKYFTLEGDTYTTICHIEWDLLHDRLRNKGYRV